MHADSSVSALLAMRRGGVIPSHRAMFGDDLVEAVSRLYADDIALYTDRFGDAGLLFR